MKCKKILAAVVSTIMTINFMSVMPETDIFNSIIAVAESYSEQEQYGDFLYYQKVDEDEDGTYDYVEITDCNESVTEVEIPSEIDNLPVTSIGDYAFQDCTNLTDVIIPDGVTTIGEAAFENCVSLASIPISKSTTNIGDSAFCNCTFTNITIPNSVISVGNYAFEGCSYLESVVISDSVTSIGDYAFSHCTNLISITFSNSITYIGNGTFYKCENITVITIPNSVTSIGNYAFSHCTLLESITIPSSVTSIGDSAFENCKSLENITIPNNVTSIGNYLFCNCESLKNIIIPNNATSLGSSAFRGCKSLVSITIPDSLVYIDHEAFYYCEALASITIPSSVTNIGNSAFENCISLESITLPNSVACIGDSAFENCSILERMIIENPECEIYSSPYTIPYETNIYSYKDSTAQVYAEKYGKNFIALDEPAQTTPIETTLTTTITTTTETSVSKTTLISENTTSIVMTTCTSTTITTDVMPYNNLSYIGYDGDEDGIYNAIEITGCDESTVDIKIPSEISGIPVKYIDFMNFSSSANVKSITVPESVISIKSANLCNKYFENLEAINVSEDNTRYFSDNGVLYEYLEEGGYKLLVYPQNKTKTEYSILDDTSCVAENAFYDCLNINVLTIPESIQGMETGAFKDCMIKKVILANGFEKVCNQQICGLSEFVEEIVLPESLKTFYGDSTFSHFTNLKKISIPESITTIPDMCFQYCDNLTEIQLSNSIESIGSYAFHGCSKLESIEVPSNLNIINMVAFAECKSLKNITIPKEVTLISDSAFSSCINLEKITIENPKCKISDYEDTISDTATIYGYWESTAHDYAKKYNREFISLDEAPEGVTGDANGDGKVNVRDAAAIASALAKGLNDTLSDVADFNGDNKVNVRDAAAIASALAKGEL